MKSTMSSGIAVLLLASLFAVSVLGQSSNFDRGSHYYLSSFVPTSKPGFCFNAANPMAVSLMWARMSGGYIGSAGSAVISAAAFPSAVVAPNYYFADWIIAICDGCNSTATAYLKMVMLTVYEADEPSGNICVYASAAKNLSGVTALTAAAVNAAWANSTSRLTPVASSSGAGYGVSAVQIQTGTSTFMKSQASLAGFGACTFAHSAEDIILINPYILAANIADPIVASSFRYRDSMSTASSSSHIVTTCIYNDEYASDCIQSEFADENSKIVMLRVDIKVTNGIACAKVAAVRQITDATYFPEDGILLRESLWDSEASSSVSGNYSLGSFGMFTAYSSLTGYLGTSAATSSCSPAITVLDLTIEKPFMNGGYIGVSGGTRTAGVAFPSTQSADILSTTQAYWIVAICDGCVAGKGGGSIKMVKVSVYLANENACIFAESAKYLLNPTSSNVLTAKIVNDAWSKAPSSNAISPVRSATAAGYGIESWALFLDHPRPSSSVDTFACLNRVDVKADVLSTKAGITTAQQCATECDKVAACKSFTLGFDNNCYLQNNTFTGKEGANGLSANYRATCISQGYDFGLSTTTFAGYTCIKNYNVRGTQVKSVTARTLATCTDACNRERSCKFLVYSGSTCRIMKDAYTGISGGITGYSSSVLATCFYTYN